MTSGRATGAESLVRSLEEAGVEVVFGIPGGAILPAYDPLRSSAIRHVLMRHEQGAGHAAEGYAHATGRAGVCLATSGPGATNLVTPLADAFMDSVPLVAITGQVPRAVIGNDAFQEADITGITMPCTKHNYKVLDPGDISGVIAEAFHIATTGRPGPVLVDIPKDVLQASTEWRPAGPVSLRGYRPVIAPHPRQIRAAIAEILRARRPVFYVGGGVVRARAAEALAALVDTIGAPVVTTLTARGAFPDDHRLALGMPGMHGNYAAITALQRADLLVCLAARFDDRVTGDLATFAPHARVIHADADPAEIGKNRAVDVPIVGDARAIVEALAVEATSAVAASGGHDLGEWVAEVRSLQRRHPIAYEQGDDVIKPQFVVDRLADLAGDALWVTGVGQHQMWASQLVTLRRPYSFVSSGGLGTMGFAVPAAIGAALGRPGERVVAIDGDGCFQMTAQELATARVEGIPLTIAILNNASLGMVKQWQTLFYDGRHSAVDLAPDVPDYVALAEAYGAIGLRVSSPDRVDDVIDEALAVDDRPCVIDFRVDPEEMCFPMVPAGAGNDDVLLGPPEAVVGLPSAPRLGQSPFPNGSDYDFGEVGT